MPSPALQLDANAFGSRQAPETARRVLQLTTGDADCYPLYYFIDSFTADGAGLVYHRSGEDRVALHYLDLRSGADRLLYQGDTSPSAWLPWDVEGGRGAWDQRSVLDRQGGRLIVFDGDSIRAVGLADESISELGRLAPGRLPIGQNCISGDGRFLVYIDADAEQFARLLETPGTYFDRRPLIRGARLLAIDLQTRQQHCILSINSPIHHVLPYGQRHLVFCHPANESGMLLTDLDGGWFTQCRTQDECGGSVCHYLATARGLAYEVLGRTDGRVLGGLYNPQTHGRYEWPLPQHFGYTHTGRDSSGQRWFYENQTQHQHDLWYLQEHRGPDDDDWLRLCGHWQTYSGLQRSHMHPQLTPDGQWILLTAGDPACGRNHLHLLAIDDLPPTRGIPDPSPAQRQAWTL